MAKTQAERAKEYRQKKRDVRDKMRDAVTAKCDETVTVEKCDAVETVTKKACRTCGGPVEHPKVVKCLKCCVSI